MSSTRLPRRWITTASIAMAIGAATAGPATAAPATPDLDAAAHYLTRATGASDGTSLAADGYYSGSGYADFGLTIDGGFALAAARSDDQTLTRVADFLEHGADGQGRTTEDWMGLAAGDPPQYVSSGAIGKTAVLAEVVGADPRSFAGQDLISDLDDEVCDAASDPNDPNVAYCAADGAYENAYSTFSQTLAIIAQLRAGDTAGAASPVGYLESQQEPSGAFPSLPGGHDADVDSTGMAVMALALVPGQTAADAVARGQSWIASRQLPDGGFRGASGDSTNSAALALLGLNLDASAYRTAISNGLAFLAAHQNADGGFDIAANTSGSDLRASTQAVSGIVGTSFGTVSDPVQAPTATTPTTTVTTTAPGTTTPGPTTTVTTSTPTATPSSRTRGRSRPALRVSRIRSPRPWYARRHGRRVVLGASLDFRLSAAAPVTVTLLQRRHGRWLRIAGRRSRAQAGADTKRVFAVRGRALVAGRYEITLVARDADGRAVGLPALPFRVG